MLTRELAEDGYSGVEVRITPMMTEVIIRATHTRLTSDKGRRIRELTSVVQKKFYSEENNMELYAEKVNNRGRLWANAHSKSLRYKLLGDLAILSSCMVF